MILLLQCVPLLPMYTSPNILQFETWTPRCNNSKKFTFLGVAIPLTYDSMHQVLYRLHLFNIIVHTHKQQDEKNEHSGVELSCHILYVPMLDTSAI